MNFNRRQADRECLCTCSDLSRAQIQDSIDLGCADADEVMFDLGTQFRCEVCKPIITRMIKKQSCG